MLPGRLIDLRVEAALGGGWTLRLISYISAEAPQRFGSTGSRIPGYSVLFTVIGEEEGPQEAVERRSMLLQMDHAQSKQSH
jgi:hypothetical protein